MTSFQLWKEGESIMKTKFLPVKPQPKKMGAFNMKLSPGDYERVKAAAENHGVSLMAFCRQAVIYALDELEAP